MKTGHDRRKFLMMAAGAAVLPAAPVVAPAAYPFGRVFLKSEGGQIEFDWSQAANPLSFDVDAASVG